LTVAPRPVVRLAVAKPKTEEQAQREFEMQIKREEEQTRKTEQIAAIAVRKVIQRIRVATPENLDLLRAELDSTMADQVENMGSLAAKVQQEAEKELMQAQKRMDEVIAKQAEAKRVKLEAELKKKEEADREDSVLAEAAEAVMECEAKAAQATEAAKPITEASKDASPDSILSAADAAEEGIKQAKEALLAASTTLNEKWTSLSKTEGSISRLGPEFRALKAKVNECHKGLEELRPKVKEAKGRAERKAVLLRQEQSLKEKFLKYDADKDGHLNRQEVAAFAVGEYDFELDEAQLDKVMRSIGGDEGLVPFEREKRLRSFVGIERSTVRARRKAQEEAEAKAELEKTKQAALKAIEEAEELVKKADAGLPAAEAASKPLASKATSSLSSGRVLEIAEEVEASIRPLQEALDGAAERLKSASKQPGASGCKARAADVEGKMKQVQVRVVKIGCAAKAAQGLSTRKALSEMEALRTKTALNLRTLMEVKGETAAQIFQRTAKKAGRSGTLNSGAFLTLVGEIVEASGDKMDEVQNVQYEKLFEHMAGGGADIPEENFLELMRLFYTVSKSTMLTESQSINSKTVRRLEPNEMVECLNAPAMDDDVGVSRGRFLVPRDDSEGWATIAGNKGTVFLQPSSRFFICVKEIVLTEEVGASSKAVQKLAKDDFVELISIGEIDLESSLRRVKARVRKSDTVGYVTITGSQGSVFLEPC